MVGVHILNLNETPCILIQIRILRIIPERAVLGFTLYKINIFKIIGSRPLQCYNAISEKQGRHITSIKFGQSNWTLGSNFHNSLR